MSATIAPEWATEAACKTFRAEMANGAGVFCVDSEPGNDETIEEYFFEVRIGRTVIAVANVSASHVEVVWS